MPVLTGPQRKTLENAVKKARQKAEGGAIAALEALSVHGAQPYGHLTPEARALRNNLRAKGRLLGDKKAADGSQSITHITYELAYEYWHSLLFASFLAANNLLMHPDGYAVTLEECEELAKEEGFADKWVTAASYASRMLPAIFRPEDPVMQVRFATEDRLTLEAILEGLDKSIFLADDSLGWVYQFWQSEAKERINESGDKIDGAKLPAVTQLFTEPYMVHFLIDNTIGAWWTARNPAKKPPVAFTYLRTKDDGSPAAGAFDAWPDTLDKLTCLDPCMGSGHFVSALFSTLAPLRMSEEGLSKDAAADAVITQNLHGLELDPRCTQIAAFNLALTAWKWAGQYRPLPAMNLACSGIAPIGKVEDWVKLVDHALPPSYKSNLEKGMRNLYALFQKAPELGSLLDPTSVNVEFDSAHFADLQPYLEKALGNIAEEESHERGIMAAGIAKAGVLLSKKYVLQITNVPYLSRGKQDDVMAEFCAMHYPDAKGDLATVFLKRMLDNSVTGGTACSVIPQNWLFLTSYKKLREYLLKNKSWGLVARLGAKSFQTPMWDFNVMLINLHNLKPKSDYSFVGIDVSAAANAAEKDVTLLTEEFIEINQSAQLKNPDVRLVFSELSSLNLLSNYATCIEGLSTGDIPRYVKQFWEIDAKSRDWQPFIQNATTAGDFVARDEYIFWQGGNGLLHKSTSAHNFPAEKMNGYHVLGNVGIRISQMGSFPCTIYTGEVFGKNGGTLICKDNAHLPAVWTFCNSIAFVQEVRRIDQSLAVTVGSFVKVPFDLAYWQAKAAELYPNGLPKPYSDDPSQWLFHGHPRVSTNPLQVALARVAGYRWPAENDTVIELNERARDLIRDVARFDLEHTDADGIICIPALAGEENLATRYRAYLQKVWGADWGSDTLQKLLAQEGATSRDIETWLREEAFAQHCKVFGNRPFLWHIWDGRKDGFSAFVNYHKLDAATLQKLIYTYLGDYIQQCEAAKNGGESGAEGRLSAAKALQAKLMAILEGEAPYDIYVRWKSLSQQPIGWNPDLNDGVRLNVRPFVEADVLRKKVPSINWRKDRGNNANGSVRINDVHLNLAEKIAARNETNG